ncbi:sensor histidine kinase [Paenibacillus sp. UNC499MF]|uniref:sensor histidine kinase n=1 Tax=Paenibacillus sp. UNC499MF TaxID=1502751 RepID=UPI0008A0820C|nr:sensor histidine kinase [Paenibacillus sp. UNC499MF]SEG35351.1 two-component system, NarL family, sensor histidine kinase DesK [Paenibacillus sp. UNC499MF]
MFRRQPARPREGPPFIFTIIWLVYLIFPVVSVLQLPFPEKILGSGLLIAFVAAYLTSFNRAAGRYWFILFQTIVIGFLAIRYNENFIYLAFYPSPVIGMLRSVRQMAAAIAGLFLMFVAVGWHYKLMNDVDLFLQLLPALVIILIMPVAMRIGRRSKELRGKLQLANEEIARLSKIEERQRISRDLHDTLGHTLSLITLKGELAEKMIPKNPEKAVREVQDIQATSRAALKQVRELVSDMNMVTIREEFDRAKQILAAGGIVLELMAGEGAEDEAPPLIGNILGMCLREAVTNVVKHSKAKVCAVQWASDEEGYRLTVSDNGIGFDRDERQPDLGTNGLRGMRERLKLVDGTCSFESAGGRGTRVVFKVPKVTKSTEKEAGGE